MSYLSAYTEGHNAYYDHKTLDDNPYELLSADGEAWNDGFEDAEDECDE